MAGSATFTTVESRMIMSIPTQRTTRAIQRDRSEAGVEVDELTVMNRP